MRFIALDVHRDFCELFGAAGRRWLAAQQLPADGGRCGAR